MSVVNWKLHVPLSPPRNEALPAMVPAMENEAQTQNKPANRRNADLFMNLPHQPVKNGPPTECFR